jgi:hypothetical protein
MNRVYSIILGFSLLFFACDEKNKPKKPENLIPKDTMEKIIYDLYIVTSAKGVNKKALEKNNVVPETYILTKYNIDSLQFAESNNYYAFNADTYKKLVNNVKARLEKEKIAFEALKKKEKEAQVAKRKRANKNKKSKPIIDTINKSKVDLNDKTLVKGKKPIVKSKKKASKN